MPDTLICDIETYQNYFLIAFKRLGDGAIRTFDLTESNARFDQETCDRLDRIMRSNEIVTFNGQSFDVPIIFKAIDGARVSDLKRAADQIITGNVKYWDAPGLLGVSVPRINHVDLIEPQPNAFASLKTLNGRLHGKRMQDLPYPPEAMLTPSQKQEIKDYCINDLAATELLHEALSEPLVMRVALGKQYDMDFRCKSDSQIGEAIIRSRVTEALGQRPERVETPAGSTFPYNAPDWLSFETPELRDILSRLRDTQFIVKHGGKVDLPDWLGKRHITIGGTTYAMGIGGLHSTERNRMVTADAQHRLIDFDVASYYPSIILGSGLYPRACGPAFLEVYRAIREERLVAKREKNKVKDQGLKISLNGVFGKLGSPYSILYAPHLMIAVTLTGQLALLMLIDRLEHAGIPVVSANTDGVVVRCPAAQENLLAHITKQWQADTGFELEDTEYSALYNQSVNTYIAVKPDGKVKRKGVLANPRAEGDLRTQMMNSPSMNVCADAAVAFLTRGIPLEQTIYECRDIRDFVTVVKVQGGGTWRGEYLGKVVRFIWSKGGEELLYMKPDPRTGNHKKVSKTDGARPLMELPDDGEWPDDLDYDRYIAAARQILVDVGYRPKVVERKAARVFKYARRGWLLASVVGV